MATANEIRFCCATPGCGARFAAEASLGGTPAHCPKCGHAVTIPPAEAATPEAVFLAVEELAQYRREGDAAIAEMNVIPFIDVCLVLLIIVLVTASFSVKLMAFEHPLALQKDASGTALLDDKGNFVPMPTEYVDLQDPQGNPRVATVAVLEKGGVTLNGRAVPMSDLGPAALALKRGGGYPPFHFVVARAVESQYVVMAADQIATVGNVQIVYSIEGQPLARKTAPGPAEGAARAGTGK